MIDVEKRKEFGEWLRSVRKQRDLSLNGAARRLGYATKGTLIGIECGQASIPIEKVHPIADLYGINLQVLLDKLQECEPDLHAKFMSLQNNFFQDFARRIAMMKTASAQGSGIMSGNRTAEQIARKHAGFAPNFLVDNLYIIRSKSSEEDVQSFSSLIPPEYFQMQQISFTFQPRPEPVRLDNVIPLFPLESESERKVRHA